MAKYLDILMFAIFDALLILIFVGFSLAPGTALAQNQELYNGRCAACHGRDGKGNGPAASAFSPPPSDFTTPGFWRGNDKQKITDTIKNGHGSMPALSDLSSSQIKAIIDYMEQAFKP